MDKAGIKHDPRNARKHSVRNTALIENSIQRDGFGRSILLANDGTVIAGNATIDAAASAGFDDVIVVESDGTKVIAVKRTDVAPGSKEFHNLAIADNRAAELAEWDPGVLAELQEDIGLSQFFQDDELARILRKLDADSEQQDPDAIPGTPADPITRPGDLWELGSHRLLCGDAQSSADRGRLMQADGSFALLFDPPWDADLTDIPGEWSAVLAFADGRRIGDVVQRFGDPAWLFVWDTIASWYTPNRPLQRMKLCAWYGDITRYQFDGSHYGDAGEPHEASNTRGTYAYQPDPRGKHLSDVFPLSLPQFHHEAEHRHAKPADWIRCLVGNCTEGDVFDPFAGSGTSVIACEQLGRTCYAMEIEPAMCDVIVRRWEQFTGQQAALESLAMAAD